MSTWNALGPPWQAAFAEATTAYLVRGSYPIGAVVLDATGMIVSRGANGFARNRLAHAELEALASIPAATDRRGCELYTTLEPCTMCTGAIRLSQIKALHFAATDPVAGSSELLGNGQFMQALPCIVTGPQDTTLASVVGALIVESRVRLGHARWASQWARQYQHAAAIGEGLAAVRAHTAWASSSLSAQALYENVASVLEPTPEATLRSGSP